MYSILKVHMGIIWWSEKCCVVGDLLVTAIWNELFDQKVSMFFSISKVVLKIFTFSNADSPRIAQENFVALKMYDTLLYMTMSYHILLYVYKILCNADCLTHILFYLFIVLFYIGWLDFNIGKRDTIDRERGGLD